MALTPGQVEIIRSTIPVLKEHGNAVTMLFYKTLLTEVPSLHNVFNQTNQENDHQATALAGALHAYATHIQDTGSLSPMLEKITQKHASLFIQPEQYQLVGMYLLRAMGDVLGSAFTPALHAAWATAYWQLANLMIAQEEELQLSTHGWTDWRYFQIVQKIVESDEITSFYLQPTDGHSLPHFNPGQYISIQVPVPALNSLQSRQYSLSDVPGQDHYRISVKRESGGQVSNILHGQAVGAAIQISHPFGGFFLDPCKEENRPLVLIAAGVGITPLISILNSAVRDGSHPHISVIQAARSSKTLAFGEYIRALAKEDSNVRYIRFIKTPMAGEVVGRDFDVAGRMSLKGLDGEKMLGLGFGETLYFVCGPEGFMGDVRGALTKMGVDRERIRMERFGTGGILEPEGYREGRP